MSMNGHPPPQSRPSPTLRTIANFETTKRLLAALVNEQLVTATLLTNSTEQTQLQLQSNEHRPKTPTHHALKDAVIVTISPQSKIYTGSKTTIELIHPEDLTLPILLRRGSSTGTGMQESAVADPGIIFDFLDPQLEGEKREDGEALRWRVREELRVSGARQGPCLLPWECRLGQLLTSSMIETWFRWAEKRAEVSLSSPMIDWEMAIIRGHPLHPVGCRLCTLAST